MVWLYEIRAGRLMVRFVTDIRTEIRMYAKWSCEKVRWFIRHCDVYGGCSKVYAKILQRYAMEK